MRSITLPSRMTIKEKRSIVQDMVRFVPSVAVGDLGEPSTWCQALHRIGCDVEPVNMNTPFVAMYSPMKESREYPLGEVIYNTARTKRTQARGLAHEFGHALCQKFIPEMIFDVDVVYSFHDDPRSTRHQIARMFDESMLGKRK